MEGCSKAIAWKTCINLKELSFGDDYVQDLSFLANSAVNQNLKTNLIIGGLEMSHFFE